MKVYVTARFKGLENKLEVETLCAAVRAAGLDDFCFIRDVEQWQKTFDNPVDLWERSLESIENCDALLIDVSDGPSGGRVLEAGIAFAQHKPIFVLVRQDVTYKDIYNGIATEVISYRTYEDIVPKLRRYA